MKIYILIKSTENGIYPMDAYSNLDLAKKGMERAIKMYADENFMWRIECFEVDKNN